MPGAIKPKESSSQSLPAQEAKNKQPRKRGGRRKSSWRKGQSGNPKGRPKKGETFTDIIRELSEASDIRTSSGERIKRKRAVVEKIYSKAIQEGDFPSIRFLIERVDPPAGEQPKDGSGLVSANIYQAIIAMVRKATAGHPEIRRKIVTEINEAFPGD